MGLTGVQPAASCWLVSLCPAPSWVPGSSQGHTVFLLLSGLGVCVQCIHARGAAWRGVPSLGWLESLPKSQLPQVAACCLLHHWGSLA